MLSNPSPIDWRALSNASDTTPFLKNKGAMKLAFFFSIMYMNEFLCGYDGTIVGGLQAFPSWHADLGNPSANLIGLLNAASFISGALISPWMGWINDNWGRKWSLRFSGYTMVIGTVLGLVAGTKSGISGYVLFLVGKFVIGAGMQAGLAACLIINQEVSHPKNRAFITALWDSSWTLGSVVASFVNFGASHINGSWQWRLPYIIQFLFALYLIIALHFVPESPRYLLMQGKTEEARKFFVDYHGNGNENDEMVNWEWEEIRQTLALEAERTEPTWRELLKVKSNRRRFVLTILMTVAPQLSGSSVVSYYYTVVLNLVGITGASVQTGISAGLNLFCFFISLAGCAMLKHWRRRPIVLTVWIMMMVFLASAMACSGVFANSGQTNTKAGIATVVLVWFFSGSNAFSGGIFYSYPAEILTYQMRAKGMAVWSVANQASGVYSTYTDSVGLSKLGYKYYSVYLAWQVVEWTLMYFLMVETKGYSLEEIAIAFDGNDAAVAIVDEKLAAQGFGGGEVGQVYATENDKESKASV